MEEKEILSPFQEKIKLRNSKIIRDFNLFTGNITAIVKKIAVENGVCRNTVRNTLVEAGLIGRKAGK